MELKELLSYFVEQGLIGKRFLLALLVTVAWIYAIMTMPSVPPEVTTVVGIIVTFYFQSHANTVAQGAA
jgi:hypothetical protein